MFTWKTPIVDKERVECSLGIFYDNTRYTDDLFVNFFQ